MGDSVGGVAGPAALEAAPFLAAAGAGATLLGDVPRWNWAAAKLSRCSNWRRTVNLGTILTFLATPLATVAAPLETAAASLGAAPFSVVGGVAFGMGLTGGGGAPVGCGFF